MKALQEEGRRATPEEKAVLARYNGFGSNSLLLALEGKRLWSDPTGWMANANADLAKLLTEAEARSALASGNNAHYTSPDIVKAVWRMLEAAGFKGGRILDPSMGTGNFEGLMPPKIAAASRVFGIEKDLITGQIAKALYPAADIRVGGFEDMPFPGGLDLAVTNVPFGDFSVADPEYDRHSLLIHDHAIVKSLASLKPGGIGVFITSAGTLDKANPAARRLMHRHADLAGAIRLPDDAHRAQADTEVTTDLLVFVRRDGPPAPDDDPAWLRSEDRYDMPLPGGKAARVNAYFKENPDAILGSLEVGTGQGGRPRLYAFNAEEPAQALARLFLDTEEMDAGGATASQRLHSLSLLDDLKALAARHARPDADNAPAELKAKATRMERAGESAINVGSFVFGEGGGGIHVITGGRDGQWTAEPADLSGANALKIEGYIKIRDAMSGVFRAQTDVDTPGYDERCQAARDLLNIVYDQFKSRFGPLNLPANRKLFVGDPACGRTMALERYDEEKKSAVKSDVFSRNVIRMDAAYGHGSAQTPADALALCLNLYGRPYPNEIGDLCGMDPDEAMRLLQSEGRAFFDPGEGLWATAETYLSGNVRAKLAKAKAALEADGLWYYANVRALEAVLPDDIPREEISVRMGSNWVPPSVVKDFIGSLVSRQDDRFLQSLRVDYDAVVDKWTADIPMWMLDGNPEAIRHSTPRKGFAELVNAGLNQQQVNVYDYVATGDGRRKAVKNEDETEAANTRLDAIKQRFKEFLWEDSDRAALLSRIYNDRFNSHVRPKYDGSHLTFPGMSSAIELRPHQKDGVWRAVCGGNALFNHEVGVGKTMLMLATAMEKRRLGLAAKPMIVVKNHMIEQIEREARQLYPDAKILAVSKEELSREGRAGLMGKISNNDWDLVIITHSQFGLVPLDPRFVEREIEDELDVLRGHLSQASGDDGKPRGAVKAIEAAVKRLEAKLKKLRNSIADGQDTGIWFDDLGVDCLIVDEAHNFKNLSVAVSDQSEIAGSAIGGSDKAFDLHMKIKWLYERLGKEDNVIFATGTPVSNNLLEIYNLQRNLQPSSLKELGIESANAWAGTFLEPKVAYEPEVSGVGFTRRLRFKLVNIPELMGSLCQVMDTVKAEDVTALELPECERETVCADVSEAQAEAMADLARRLEEIRTENVDPRVDNLLKIVSEGRKLALEMRLLDCFAQDEPGSKVNLMVEKAVAVWHETKAARGTQLIFSDLGVHGEGYNLYKDIKKKLVEAGIPEGEIAFAQDAKTDKAKAELFARVRSGAVRFLLGSTMVMGEGTNVQTRLAAVHHLDAPWRPSDIAQRRGRMVRHGNIHDNVREYIYVTEGTFDAFMWTTLKTKAENFVQVMSGRSDIRVFDMDADPTFAEALAVASSNPLVKERMEAEQEVSRLSSLVRSQAKHAALYRRLRQDHEYDLDKALAARADEAAWLSLRRPLPAGGAAGAEANADTGHGDDGRAWMAAGGGLPEDPDHKPWLTLREGLSSDVASADGGDSARTRGADANADMFSGHEDGAPRPLPSGLPRGGGWTLDLDKWTAAGGGMPDDPDKAEALKKAVLDGVDMHALRSLLSGLMKSLEGQDRQSEKRGFDLDPGLSYRGIPVSLWIGELKRFDDGAGKKGKDKKPALRLEEWVLSGNKNDHAFKSASGVEHALDSLEGSIGRLDTEIATLRKKAAEAREAEAQFSDGGADYAKKLEAAQQRLDSVIAEIEGAGGGRPQERQWDDQEEESTSFVMRM